MKEADKHSGCVYMHTVKPKKKKKGHTEAQI